MPSNQAPDLRSAWINHAESHEDTLVLRVDGVRRFGLLFGGKIVFQGISRIDGFDPRLTSGTPVLSSGLTIRAQRSQPGETVLELVRTIGPGEVDEPRFVIAHGSVTKTLRLKPGATFRAWMGFYPLPRDRTGAK
jgi:hypothetical protein